MRYWQPLHHDATIVDAAAVFRNIAQKVYPRNHSNCTILDRRVFENFVLADKPFAKTLQIHETCVLANNNWCEKLISSLESPTSFDEIFKVTWVPFFFPDFNLLSYEFDNVTFKVL